ncbi:ankyrin [Neocallimastix lanati (nom. inval.)]|nr:ankyrin [Neocallimastix sp. JGI-2020a]
MNKEISNRTNQMNKEISNVTNQVNKEISNVTNQVNKEISKLNSCEIENCEKNVENSKPKFSNFEKNKFQKSSLPKKISENQTNLKKMDPFEVSLNVVLNSRIILTDKALQKILKKDILGQIDDLEETNNENFKNIPNIIYDTLENISSNEEVKMYLEEINMDLPKLKEGVHKLFESLMNNVVVTAAPRDENQRKLEYNKLLKGYKVIAQILKESSIEPILKLGNVIMISEVSNYCASGWKDTLLELLTNFSFEIKEKYKDAIHLDYEKDPLKKILNEIFFNARECITKEISYKYINDHKIRLSQRPHYIDTFKQVFNEVYHLNLPFIETTDSYLGIENKYSIRKNFTTYLKNICVNDLIYDKACELFYDRLKEEPDLYEESKSKANANAKPKFWGDIMECPVDFMLECILGDESNKSPIRYIAIKEIMKDCGFIEEIMEDDRYGDEYYNEQSEICMTRLKRGIMDIKNEKELGQLNKELIHLQSRGIDIEALIAFIIEHEHFKLIDYIRLDSLNIDVNEADENGVTKLMKVCQSCSDCKFIQYLLSAKALINQQDNNGLNALMYAIEYNKNVSISKFLIEHGADVNIISNNKWNVLMTACYYSEDIELIRLLLDEAKPNINQQINEGWTALMIALRYNKNINISKFLIENGADVNLVSDDKWNALMHACYHVEDLELIKLLMEAGSNLNQQSNAGWTALMYSIRYNRNAKVSEILIENGADINLVNNENWTGLMFACRYSEDVEFIKLLINKDTNINQQSKSGWTALMLAIRYNTNSDIAKFLIENSNNKISKFLIESGAHIKLNDDEDDTPFMIACRYSEDLELIKLFISSGSTNINQQNRDGWSVLMIAIRYNRNINISKFLIESGINVNLLNHEKETALMYACRYSDDLELIKRLIDAGSDIHQQNSEGLSAVMIAKKYNPNHKIYKYLLKKEAALSSKRHKKLIYSFMYKFLI